ncbi:ABC transporter substrate-binding protein [Nocardioides marmorisolisilvae]|uniref:ABC transporter substrate-binding protein n=1 Tax=Nocardioides marmorisolisilvae TaxID=1542737 RepID=A0A3N0DX26_9ACTN|nr:ABC transporter substrate-binding protein [Nocardioides marmorisolisilvae]
MHPRPTLRGVHAPVLVTFVASLALVLAGCGGSAIDPKTAARANNLGLTSGNGQQVTSVNGPVSSNGPVVSDGATNGPSGSSTGGPGGPSGQGTSGPGAPAAPGGASCAGFKNSKGITNDTLRIGNSSDISGPVPGLFTAAQQATAAYVNYFNSTGGRICGRKLQLDLYDSHTDAGGDQIAYAKGCESDFAMVGSMSAFDSGGAKTAESCGIPDIRAISTTVERGTCKTCFSAQPAGPDAFQNAVPDFIKRRTGGKNAAMLYINVGASAANGKSQAQHMAKRGMHYVVNQGIDITDFNYSPYVQQMKEKNVQSVQFIASSAQFVRLAQAMVSLDFHPKVVMLDPSAYNSDFTGPGGSAVVGTYVFMNFVPFEEASRNPEITLYERYLQQVAPGAKPTFFGLFAWSSTRLFVQQAVKLGGKLNRASLIASMRGVDNWTSNGAHAPQHVGSKKIGDCWRFIQWNGKAWVPVEGRAYHCDGLTY